MTRTGIRSLLIACVLLQLLGALAASGHEAHRKSQAIAVEVPIASPTSPLPPASPAEPILAPDDPTDPPRSSPLSWLGRLHPMMTHFPIALFLAALVSELLFAATREVLFRHALRVMLWGGAMGAVIAAPLGWWFAASGAGEEGWILEAHRWAGTAAACLGIVVLWIGERTERASDRRLLLRIGLFLQALLIGSVGYLGGSLLYGIDHFWRAN